MPTSRPFSTIGTRLMPCVSKSAAISRKGVSGEAVMTFRVITSDTFSV